MALLFMDSCDHYLSADAAKKYTTVPSLGGNTTLSNTNPGASTWPGGGGVQVWKGAVTSSGCSWNSPSNDATVIMGGWFYFSNTVGPPAGIGNLLLAAYDTTSNQWDIRRDSNNHLIFCRNNGGTTLATSVNSFLTNTWYFIEMKVTTNSTTGVYEVRVNGSSTGWIPQATGANTRATANNYTNVYWFGVIAQNNAETSWRGVYVLNNSGGITNDFIGVNTIRCLRPAGAGNYAQWTPNVGTNYGAVDDMFGDGDASYVQSTTASQIDSFSYQDMPGNGSVYAVQHVFMSRQDGGTARVVAPFQRVPGASPSDFAGASKTQAGSYVFYMDPQTTNPATTAQWTIADINAAEFGYKLIT